MIPNRNLGQDRDLSGDMVAVIFIAALMGGTTLAWITGMWQKAVTFLVTHNVLAPASQPPLVTIPGAGGAGLDDKRLILVGGLLLIFLAMTGARMGRLRREKRSMQ